MPLVAFTFKHARHLVCQLRLRLRLLLQRGQRQRQVSTLLLLLMMMLLLWRDRRLLLLLLQCLPRLSLRCPGLGLDLHGMRWLPIRLLLLMLLKVLGLLLLWL